MTSDRTIAIIGPGCVGTALAVLAARAGYTVTAIGGRNESATQSAASQVGSGVEVTTIHDAAAAGDIVLLCVSDDAIETVCNDLAAGEAFRSGVIVAHCSGALGSDILSTAKAQGCLVGSVHPLQTFPTADAAIERFAGTYCFCEGDAQAVDVLMELARAMGGKPVFLPSAGKALYHAAAVVAGNYTTALLDAAVGICEQAGIDPADARKALAVLAETSAGNAATMDLPESLTGPIARGDVGTIRRHLDALQACPPRRRELYCVAGLQTIDLAVRKGTITNDTAQQLRDMMEASQPKE
ncbi:MAG: Rossmann-like and DUF2520 domain-containing protein [Planctomycetota bacterium]|jgi:predicted short-subunit dehydrogenase-like oxidoreductase (DUF2520 family)